MKNNISDSEHAHDIDNYKLSDCNIIYINIY